MKKRLLTLFFLFSFLLLKAQMVINVTNTDKPINTSEYVDFSEVFSQSDESYHEASQKYTDDLYFILTSESISSDEEFTFFHEYFVDKSGVVKFLKFELKGNSLKITKEQKESIEKKIVEYVKQNNFDVQAKKNWHEMSFSNMPKLAQKRFFRDYIQPNPEPTESENTKMGIIQRLGNYCTEKWQKEGPRDPMELKFKGLVNVCLYTLDDDNPLFAKLKKLCPTESADALMGQIYDYMILKCPIYLAKYGFYQFYPDYVQFLGNHCACIENALKNIDTSMAEVDRLYEANDTCKSKAFESDIIRKAIYSRSKAIYETAKKNNEDPDVASKIYLSGLDGYAVYLNCSIVHKEWKRDFVEAMQRDSMVDVFWSEKRYNWSMMPINFLYNNMIDNLKNDFRSDTDFQKNKKELEQIAKELRQAKDIKPGLIGQRSIKGEYIEEIVIFDKNLSVPFFEVRMHFEKKGDVDKLIRIEYIPKAKVDLSRRTFNGAKKGLGQ